MSDETLIRCCAPTLAAIKTGSLLNCPFDSREEMTARLREINRSLIPKGVCALPLRYEGGKALVYLYRPSMLTEDLRLPVAAELLRDAGYPGGSTAGHIAWLIRRLKESESFPHEIGLFLGYPAVDVRGFIRREECKCTGLWKVDGSDLDQAQQTFARCRRCTKAYLQRRKEGWDLSRLAIRPGQFSYSEAERLERKETT